MSTDGGNTFSNVAGAISATFTFNTTAAENGDEYRAVFTNSSGTATSAPATLTVNTTPGGLVISAANGVFPQFNFAVPPQDSPVAFGAQILTLSTGNIVVTGTGKGAGAVYLYNGQTGALISDLEGANNVTALTNGNFVATGGDDLGPGTVTWGSGTTGVSGTVSAANSLVDSRHQIRRLGHSTHQRQLRRGFRKLGWQHRRGGVGERDDRNRRHRLCRQ